MVELRPTVEVDIPKIEGWIQVDPWHKADASWTADGLLTGKGLLTFCITDEIGPICFVRLDVEGDMLRLATQFGPETEVSKRRLVDGLLSVGIPSIVKFGKVKGFKGIVFESVSESLIGFMNRQGFFKAAGKDDYALTFDRG